MTSGAVDVVVCHRSIVNYSQSVLAN
jgi:hypothetical protein